MANPPAVELARLAASLALSVVETQRKLDQQYERDVKAVLPAAQLLAEFGLGGVRSVLPARPMVSHMKFDARISVTRSRAFAFALMARPVNLGFRISHESTEATEAKIHLEIEQVPFPAASPGPAR